MHQLYWLWNLLMKKGALAWHCNGIALLQFDWFNCMNSKLQQMENCLIYSEILLTHMCRVSVHTTYKCLHVNIDKESMAFLSVYLAVCLSACLRVWLWVYGCACVSVELSPRIGEAPIFLPSKHKSQSIHLTMNYLPNAKTNANLIGWKMWTI